MSDQNYQLLVQRGPEPGKVYPLSSVSITIGRDPMAEITITDPEVSRQHVHLLETPSGYSIQDLGSTNGTYVDGERLSGEAVDLIVGQIITMGAGVALRFESRGEFDQDEMATMLDGSRNVSELAIGDGEDNIDSLGIVEADNDVPIIHQIPVDVLELESEERLQEEFGAGPKPQEEGELSFDQGESAPHTDLQDEQETGSQIDDQLASESSSQIGRDPVVIPHQGDPDLAEPNHGDNNWRTPAIIVSLLLLIICCCCSFFLFLYYYGGDWLLRQMGLLP